MHCVGESHLLALNDSTFIELAHVHVIGLDSCRAATSPAPSAARRTAAASNSLRTKPTRGTLGIRCTHKQKSSFVRRNAVFQDQPDSSELSRSQPGQHGELVEVWLTLILQYVLQLCNHAESTCRLKPAHRPLWQAPTDTPYLKSRTEALAAQA